MQPYIGIICARFESFPMSNICMTSISKILIFLNFVYNSVGASLVGSTTFYILMHNFIISKHAGFELSILKWAKLYVYYDTKHALICDVFWCETWLILWLWRNYVTAPTYWWNYLWSVARRKIFNFQLRSLVLKIIMYVYSVIPS